MQTKYQNWEVSSYIKKTPKQNPKSSSDIWGPTGSGVLPPLRPYLPVALVQLSWPPCWSFNTPDMVLPLYLWTCCSIGLEKPLTLIKGLICSLTSFKFVITSYFIQICYHLSLLQGDLQIISSKTDPPTPCSHPSSSVLWLAFSVPWHKSPSDTLLYICWLLIAGFSCQNVSSMKANLGFVYCCIPSTGTMPGAQQVLSKWMKWNWSKDLGSMTGKSLHWERCTREFRSCRA